MGLFSKTDPVTHWGNVIVDLSAKAETARAQAAKLGDERRAILLDAETGDDKAAARAQELAFEQRKSEQRAVDLAAAVEQARAKLREAEAGAEREQRRERAGKIRESSAALLRVSKRVDTLLSELAELLGHRQRELSTLRELTGAQQGGPLFNDQRAWLAGLAHGLERPLKMTHYMGPRAHQQPLEDLDRTMVEPFTGAQEWPAEAVTVAPETEVSYAGD